MVYIRHAWHIEHLSPLGSDTIAPLNLPPVRLGLLTKLNLLTVGLIFLTALAISGWFHWQQYQDEEAALRAQGGNVLLMLAEASGQGLATGDRAYLDGILGRLSADTGIAYASILDARLQPLAERNVGRPAGTASPAGLETTRSLSAGVVSAFDRSIDGARYIELVTPVIGGEPAARGSAGAGSAASSRAR